jgi:hypothetical protein
LSFQIQILIWKHKAVKDLEFLFHTATLASRNLTVLKSSFLQGNEFLKCDQMWPARFNFPGRLYRSHKLVSVLSSFLSLLCGKVGRASNPPGERHYKKLVNPCRFLGDVFTNRH